MGAGLFLQGDATIFDFIVSSPGSTSFIDNSSTPILYLLSFFLSVCDECERPYEGDCPIHDNIIPIPDTPTTSNSLPNPSVASLPQGIVVRQSTIQHAGLGVFTTQQFQQGSTFGPYRGVRLRADVPKESFDTTYIWEVCGNLFKPGIQCIL